MNLFKSVVKRGITLLTGITMVVEVFKQECQSWSVAEVLESFMAVLVKGIMDLLH